LNSIDISIAIEKAEIDLRMPCNMKLPDCIIAASSVYVDVPLINRDGHFKQVQRLRLFVLPKKKEFFLGVLHL